MIVWLVGQNSQICQKSNLNNLYPLWTSDFHKGYFSSDGRLKLVFNIMDSQAPKKLMVRLKHSRRVFVAMSGGVDSSVATALLKKRGFSVIGVFMKPWNPEIDLQPTTYNLRQKKKKLISSESLVVSRLSLVCPWRQDREDAMRAASVLGIPLLTWDFSKQYKKAVVDYMIREYRVGRTPNPDVMCNKEIKFGLFFDRAIKEGADYVATGHYVRIAQVKNEKLKMKSYKLLIAKDKNKDQSYFLWTLKQKQLAKCLFPIGDYIKPEVRKMAKKFGLPNYDKKDSQGVCFIGLLDMKDFLTKYIKPKNGRIIYKNKQIGIHDGVYYYTIGQRHGLNIGIGGGPYYVVSKDIKKNIIYVGGEKDLYSKNLKISNISWVNDVWKFNFQTGHLGHIEVKIRYRSQTERAILSKNGTLKFLKPVRAITSGQSAVFYRRNEMLGGGIIS